MFDFNGFAQDVHKVAVEHGWWEGERDEAEVFALIHSEWSEALEEHRAGRPMVWHKCNWDGEKCGESTCGFWEDGDCDEGELDPKPEGIAVELIDGVLRCMDYLAAKDDGFMTDDRARRAIEVAREDTSIHAYTLPEVVCELHEAVSRVTKTGLYPWLWYCVFVVWVWLEKQGVDPEAVIRAKHEYDKTRPYKHGKRY